MITSAVVEDPNCNRSSSLQPLVIKLRPPVAANKRGMAVPIVIAPRMSHLLSSRHVEEQIASATRTSDKYTTA